MDEPKKQSLMQYTVAAKAVIYNADRLKQLIPMMDSPEGAIQAVQAVMGAVEQRKPVPPDVAPLLGVNIYMLLVDVASDTTGEEPDRDIVRGVISQILASVGQSHSETGEPAQAEQMEPAAMQAREQQAGAEMPAEEGLVGRAMGV